MMHQFAIVDLFTLMHIVTSVHPALMCEND